jgi:hypothetical protein
MSKYIANGTIDYYLTELGDALAEQIHDGEIELKEAIELLLSTSFATVIDRIGYDG